MNQLLLCSYQFCCVRVVPVRVVVVVVVVVVVFVVVAASVAVVNRFKKRESLE